MHARIMLTVGSETVRFPCGLGHGGTPKDNRDNNVKESRMLQQEYCSKMGRHTPALIPTCSIKLSVLCNSLDFYQLNNLQVTCLFELL